MKVQRWIFLEYGAGTLRYIAHSRWAPRCDFRPLCLSTAAFDRCVCPMKRVATATLASRKHVTRGPPTSDKVNPQIKRRVRQRRTGSFQLRLLTLRINTTWSTSNGLPYPVPCVLCPAVPYSNTCIRCAQHFRQNFGHARAKLILTPTNEV